MCDKIIDIKTFLNTVDGDINDICAAFYLNYLNGKTNESTAANNLFILLNWDYHSDNSYKLEPLYTSSEYEEMIKKTQQVIFQVVDNLIDEKVDEDVFYIKLWDFINQEIVFPSSKERIGAIICLLKNSKIPYFKLEDGMKMDDTEFKEISKHCIKEIKKAIFIINAGYSQKTEVASQLLRILNNFENPKDQTVFLANVLGIYEFRILKFIQNQKETEE